MSAAAVLELLVQLKDEASSGLQSIGSTLGGIGSFLGTAAIAGGIAGITALGGVLGMAISEASEAQQGIAQLEAVIESTGGKAGVTKDQVLDLASSLSAAGGLSQFTDDAILAGENLLLTFTNIGSEVFPIATQAMVDMATAMGGDPQAQAIQLGKALNDPIAGISALSRVGVTFTEDQKKMIESMVEAGNVAGAQKLILNELATEFGGSASKAAGTFSGQMITLKERFNGILENIGMELLPMLQELTGYLSSPEVMGTIEELGALFAEGVGGAMRWLATTAIPAVKQAWIDMQPKIVEFQEYWSETLYPAIQRFWDFTSTYILPLLAALANVYFAYLQKQIEAVAYFVTDVLGPALTWLNDNILAPLGVNFDNIGKGIEVVIGWLNKLASGINSISIPDWLEGHSPPPLANWLSDIAVAAGAATDQLPDFGTIGTPRLAPVGAASASGGGYGSITININGATKSPREIALETRDELIKLQKRDVSTGMV